MNTLRLIQVRLITELFNAVGGLLFSLLTLSRIVSYMKKYTAIDCIGFICFQGLDLDLGPHLAITGHQTFAEYILRAMYCTIFRTWFPWHSGFQKTALQTRLRGGLAGGVG